MVTPGMTSPILFVSHLSQLYTMHTMYSDTSQSCSVNISKLSMDSSEQLYGSFITYMSQRYVTLIDSGNISSIDPAVHDTIDIDGILCNGMYIPFI